MRGLSERLVPAALAGVALALAVRTAGADDGTVAARARTVGLTLSAYAQVEPTALVRINAAYPGIVAGLRVLPGEALRRGAVLGRLEGPEVEALRSDRRNAVAGARASLAAARESLAAAKGNRALRVATRQTLAQAEAAVARARAALDTAAARRAAARAALSLRAPVAGTVLGLDAGDGERVAPGQTILTLQPAHGLWLKAAFYGAAAREIHPGMKGRFSPAGGGASVAVRVRSVYGALRADGAREVGLVATRPRPTWLSGTAGTVTFETPPRTLAAIPTPALILDRGQWWVLVRGAHGDERRAVTPGPSRGEWTLIERGLEPGTRVVVANAYLEFHRAVARHYQPPD